MRVLMINYEYPPLGGGSGIATFHLLSALDEVPDLEVDLITAGTQSALEWRELGPRTRIALLPVHKTDQHFWTAGELAVWFGRALSFARRLTARQRYDLCHCWSGWPSGVIGHHLRNRQPYLVALRGSDVPGYSARTVLLDRLLLRRLSRRVWRQARVVTAVSENLRDLARCTFPGLEARVIYNGVDTRKFHPATQPVEPFTILVVGRLIRRKAVEKVVEGVAPLLTGDSSCRLVVVGGGPQRRSIEALTARLGVADNVTLLGNVPHDHLAPVYRQASVFVMPSAQEGLSNAMLESMASGLPVVVTPTGGAELIDDSGVVIASASAKRIFDAVDLYRSDPDLRERHGRRARQIAESLTWERTMHEYLAIYGEAVG